MEGAKKKFTKNMRLLMNLWPPFLGGSIRVTRLDADWRAVDVEMKLRWWNRNYVGTHYGGSLYSMADPFYMVMLIENLGRDYVVWDKSASIRFRRPGRGTVRAQFRLTEAQVKEIKQALKNEEKIEREFVVEVKDAQGEVVAEVKKLLHFRKKK
jgi:acyl-coenzyme A thioesterase PaaI-like protein